MGSIWIALTDDWELRGNGMGSVYELQYLTSLKLMDLYDRLGVKGTFHLEVLQQIAFLKYSKQYRKIKKEAEYWREAVETMHRRGFDVQLHIHPQWHNAVYDGNFWKLDKRWNITDYSTEEIDLFVDTSVNYLKEVLPDHEVVAFRAGAWGAAPKSRPLFESLESHGIKVDVSMCHGSYYDGESMKLDYTQLQSPYLPYYPDYDDVRKISTKKTGIIEIPTQAVLKKDLPVATLLISKLSNKIRNIKNRISNKYSVNSSDHKKNLPYYPVKDPFGFASGRGYQGFIMDLSVNHNIFLWKKLINFTLSRALSLKNGECPVVLIFENHTKDLVNSMEEVENIIRYIKRKYSRSVEFVTLKQVAENINNIRMYSQNNQIQ
jgi:hypothetical protein